MKNTLIKFACVITIVLCVIPFSLFTIAMDKLEEIDD